ncbi:MAG: D-sedoheptulose 7-phosphate isomerase [Rhodospirillales bacterium]|nr:D-sedoheptulose 7-phosphate isomerase [Rhodospirillales bacterium]
MDLDAFFAGELDEHMAAVQAVRTALLAPFSRLVQACAGSIRGGGKIVLFGNGGSAADAQHLATELCVCYSTPRAPIAALALTTDTSALTAIGNDLGFARLFARQIEALCRPGDVCIGISTSGESDNVLAGLAAARKLGCVAAGLAGRDGGRMVGLAEPLLIVPARSTPRIQELHITLGHMLCAALEAELGLA